MLRTRLRKLPAVHSSVHHPKDHKRLCKIMSNLSKKNFTKVPREFSSQYFAAPARPGLKRQRLGFRNHKIVFDDFHVLLLSPLFEVFKNPEHYARALLSTLKMCKFSNRQMRSSCSTTLCQVVSKHLQALFFKLRIAVLRSGHWSCHSCLQQCSKPSEPPRQIYTNFTSAL